MRPRRVLRSACFAAWLALAAGASVGLWVDPEGAHAQWADPTVSVDVSSNIVEVGEAFSLQIKAMVAQGAPVPTDPAAKAPAGVTLEGPRVTTQTNMSWVNGVSTSSVGVSALWLLTPTREGKLKIPSPTVQWMGRRLGGNPVEVTVVGVGKKPRKPQRQGGFLLPGGPNFPWPFGASPLDDAWPADTPDDDSIDKRLALPQAPFNDVFLHATVDKKSAVIGEQVTISFYAYSRDLFDVVAVRTAPLSDFLREPLLKDPDAEPVIITTAGDQRFRAKLIDKIALFPVKTGDLHTGSYVQKLMRRGRGGEIERRTEDFVIRVTEPPKAGRPPGYQLGDVGQFAISTLVEPRRVEQDGSVAVLVKVTGKGNLPQTLAVPATTDVEWLDPEKKEHLEPGGGQISGWRSFGYVVRVHRAGTVDLGRIDLPYWDPDAKRYQVASTTLGTVEVTPSKVAPAPSETKAAPAEPEATTDPLALIGSPRAELAPYAAAPKDLVEGSGLWLLLGSPPFALGLFAVGARAASGLKERRAKRRDSASALVAKAIAEAEGHAAAEDLGKTAASLDRALHLAVEDATDLKSRGVLLDDLEAALSETGVPAELAARISLVLKRCDALRFAPGESAEGPALVAEAKAIVRALERAKGRA